MNFDRFSLALAAFFHEWGDVARGPTLTGERFEIALDKFHRQQRSRFVKTTSWGRRTGVVRIARALDVAVHIVVYAQPHKLPLNVPISFASPRDKTLLLYTAHSPSGLT